MIRVPRTTAAPDSLLKRKARDPGKGTTELERVLAAFRAHGRNKKTFKFDYERYGDTEVRNQLRALFHGKCAYCESRYAGIQPVDVEHWRPKGGVLRDDGKVEGPGYYWLAATWDNLLPSCIDCNRSRQHVDATDPAGGPVTVGKANQFPLEDPDARVERHNHDLSGERPMLLNPCVDDPTEHLSFADDGVVEALTERGAESIRVYALNRFELVQDRLALLRLIERQLDLIARLSDVRNQVRAMGTARATELADLIETLVGHEVNTLLEMTDERRPYAGMARQVIGRELDAARNP